MHAWLVALVLTGAPDPWEPPGAAAPHLRKATPGDYPLADAYSDAEAVLRGWARERREIQLDREERDRWLSRPPEPAAAEEESPTDEPPQVLRKGAAPSRYGKIIEIAPADPPKRKPASWVEQEIDRLEDDQASLERRRQEDPRGYQKERARRATVREGNRAWDQAVAKRHAEQAAQIEADAARMQAALETARRKDEEAHARRMGGALDAQGNFVDPDLEEKHR